MKKNKKKYIVWGSLNFTNTEVEATSPEEAVQLALNEAINSDKFHYGATPTNESILNDNS